jgi:hypothetical protein
MNKTSNAQLRSLGVTQQDGRVVPRGAVVTAGKIELREAEIVAFRADPVGEVRVGRLVLT